MTMTQNDLFSCCQAKTILTHEPVAAPRKKKIPKDAAYVTSSKCATCETILGVFRGPAKQIPPKICIFLKNVVSLQKKTCISAKYSSKLDILHSICIFFASSTKGSVTRASQGASITTKVGHNRRPTPVIY